MAFVASKDSGWLFLHGTPLSPRIWEGVIARLPVWAQVSAPAMVTAPGATASVQAAAAATVIAGLRRVQSDPVHLVGHSFGGQVALDIALAAPDLVGTLTMICSRATPYPAFGQVAAGLRKQEPVDVQITLQRWFTAAELARGGRVIDYARNCLMTADRADWAHCLQAIAEYDRSSQLHSLDLPVMLLAAERDPVSDPATMAAMCKLIPGARLQVVIGAAHLSPFLRPNELLQLIQAGPYRGGGANDGE